MVKVARELSVRTSGRAEFVNITSQVEGVVRESGVKNGICNVFCAHTTAGLTINENADPDVVTDIIATLERLAPRSGAYEHVEGNSDAHVKSSLMGASLRIPIMGGKMSLGTWQGIFFCEFDGPRSRRVIVQIME